MTEKLKVFEVDTGDFWCIGSFKSAGKAKANAAMEFGMDFVDVRVRRVKFLDGFNVGYFDDDTPPDAILCCLRHGWRWTLYDKGYEEVIKPPESHSEADWRALAERIGATYPDKYAPEWKDAGNA